MAVNRGCPRTWRFSYIIGGLSSPAVSAAPQTIHLHPVAALADRAILPGDPGRALTLATALLGDDRKMFNHQRGLWGYTGTAADGRALTIQSTGLGGPSAAIVLEELAMLGVRTVVRAGTARAVDGSLGTGDLVAATELRGDDGAARALGGPERRPLDAELVALLAEGADAAGPLGCTDLFYDPEPQRRAAWTDADVLAVDLQSAALAAVAARHELRFATVVAITADAAGARLAGEALEAVGEAVGRAACTALLACG